jgi:hypothetical protein
MKREWAAPLILGLVVAAGLWLVPAPRHVPAPVSDAAIVLPFDSGVADRWTNVTFIVLAPHGKPAALAELNASGDARLVEWRGQHLALYTTPARLPACLSGDRASFCIEDGNATLLPRLGAVPAGAGGPRLGVDGYNATRVTAYVFDSAGALFATNANDTARFAGAADAQRLPGGAWYLGDNGTAPPGTHEVPAFAGALLAHMMPLLHGLPVGGVASIQTNAAVALYGTLFVTVRIDGLVQAP